MRTLSTDDIEIKSTRYGPMFDLRTGNAPQFWVDSWNKQRSPTPYDLLKEYTRIAYAAANLNANLIFTAKLRLFTKSPDKRRKTGKVPGSIKKKLVKQANQKLAMGSQGDIEELTEHNFLDLWHSPNQWHASEWLKLYQLYQETVGCAYVKFIPDRLKNLQEWWVLPSQVVRPIRDQLTYGVTHFVVNGHQYPAFPTDDGSPYIIAFPMLNPHDPYGGVGLSPLRAAFESVNLNAKMLATEAAILDNEGRPSGILSPEEPIGSAEAGRWETRFNAKFRQSGSGNVLVSEEKLAFTPITFPPKDLAALEVAGMTKSEVLLCFGVPAALCESSQFNRATLDTSIVQHVRQAGAPRLRDIEAKWNKYILPLFGDDLFIAFDDPSPESDELVASYLKTLVDSRIITPNEARFELDYMPRDDGENLQGLPGTFDPKAGSSSAVDAEDATEAPEAEAGSQDKPADATDNVQATALNGAQIASLMQIAEAIATGQLPPDTGRAIIVASFPTLTEAQIDDIIGPLENFEPEAPEPKPSPIVMPGQAPPKPPKEQPPKDQPKEDQPAKLILLGDTKAHANHSPGWKDPPYSEQLEVVVRNYFDKFRQSALRQVAKDLSARIVRKEFVPLNRARDELVKDSRPLIEVLLVDGGKQLMQRVGFDPDVFSVTNPKVREAVQKAAFAFCDSTNKSTTQRLNDALAALRQTLADDLSEGERLHKITAKVNEIFDGLETDHAHLIAQTESSRAHHEGMKQAAIESGVVTGFKLLISPDACQLCKSVEASKGTIALDGYFHKDESAPEPYQERLVPIHPGCRCAMLELTDEGE